MSAQDIRIISADDLNNWLDQILADYTVLAPTRQGHYTNFALITSADQLDLQNVNTRMSPKHLFFPKTERLFGFSTNRHGVNLSEPEPEIPAQVLFGVRPCDVRAITMLDMVFDTEIFRDSRYVTRRDATTIIALACNCLCPTCFCTTLGGGPAQTAGSDIIMIQLPDARFGLKPLTEKGQNLLEDADLPSQAPPEDQQAFDQALQAARQSDSTKPINHAELAKKLADIFDSDFWDHTHQRCIGCGTCTYLCPTCHCFDIAEEATNNAGQRVRNWDSCMFDLFTLHASGHNPRPSQKQHLRQRIMHKFSYTVERYNQTFCVGCGRCVTRCPVNIDLREILNELEDYCGG